MPMLTVRLTDEEMARLKEIAAGTSVAKVVREWIEASHLLMRGESLPVAAVSHETLPDQAPLPGGTTAIVDGQYERNPDDQMALPGAPKRFKLAKAGMAKMLIEDTRAAFKAATEHLSEDEVDTAAKVAAKRHAPQEMTVAEWDSQHQTHPSVSAVFLTKPSFLAAPDEDCVCGHDRHSFHLAGPCSGFVGRVRCDCTGFLADLGFG